MNTMSLMSSRFGYERTWHGGRPHIGIHSSDSHLKLREVLSFSNVSAMYCTNFRKSFRQTNYTSEIMQIEILKHLYLLSTTLSTRFNQARIIF